MAKCERCGDPVVGSKQRCETCEEEIKHVAPVKYTTRTLRSWWGKSRDRGILPAKPFGNRGCT